MNCKNHFIQLEIFVDTSLESIKFILVSENIFGHYCGNPQYEICLYNSYTKCEKNAKIQFFQLYILSHGTQSGTQNFRIEKYDVSTL